MIQFSVITITYNAARCLQPTLRSVAAQTYPGVEHIIVDGASTDDTLVMAQAYSADTAASGSNHRVRVQSEHDSGLYDAMNKGLRLATGTYVVFLNAGDFFPDATVLHDVAAAAERAGTADGELPAVVYGHTDIVDAEGRFVCHRRLAPPQQLSWRSFRNGMLVCHQAFYARTDIAARTPYNLAYRYSADVDWCIRVMRLAEEQRLPLANAGRVVACYTREGLSTIHHRDSLRERFHVMCTHYGLVSTLFYHAWFVARGVLHTVKLWLTPVNLWGG